MKLTRIRFEWKIEDMWVGVFWKHLHCATDSGPKIMATDVWVCVVPCLPLHLTVMHSPQIGFH